MKPLSQCLLYAFIDTAYLHGRDPADLALQLIKGGADIIQLRAMDKSNDEVRRMAEAIQPLTRSNEVHLVINDHLDVAQEVGAEFCHFGQEDFFDAGYTGVADLPTNPEREQPRIGLSTHAPEQAERAVQAGAHYIAIGPVFRTGTKPAVPPVTLEYVRWAAAHVDIPWFAIGGITLENLDQVMQAGARRVCVVSAILNSRDAIKACREFRQRLEEVELGGIGPRRSR